MNPRQTVGFIGAALLIIGVFCPFLTVPIAGSITLFNSGAGDGVLLLVLAVIAAVLTFLRRFQWIWYAAALSAGLLIFKFVSLYFTMLGTKEASKISLADNPFAGLGDAFMSAIQISWGLPVMVIGVVLLAVSAAMREPVVDTPGRRAPWLHAGISGGLVALILIGSLAYGQSERASLVAKARVEAAKEAERKRQEAAAAAAQAKREEEERQRAEAAAAAEEQAKQDAVNQLELANFEWQNEEYSRYLVGTITNNSNRTINFISIKIDLLDDDKNKVGDADDITESLEPGQVWKFKAMVLEDGATNAQVRSITGTAE